MLAVIDIQTYEDWETPRTSRARLRERVREHSPLTTRLIRWLALHFCLLLLSRHTLPEVCYSVVRGMRILSRHFDTTVSHIQTARVSGNDRSSSLEKSKEKQLHCPFVLLERAGLRCRDREFSFTQEVPSEKIQTNVTGQARPCTATPAWTRYTSTMTANDLSIC
jgi:hypothetical protein